MNKYNQQDKTMENSKDTHFRDIVVILVNTLKKNMVYKPVLNDITRIDNFTEYVFSRFVDKLQSVSANYIRIDWLINKINFAEIQHIHSDENQNIENESLIELVAVILRPLTEIYLEIKYLGLAQTKYNLNIEDSCKFIVIESITENYRLKRKISKDFYHCEPKYLKYWHEEWEKQIKEVKRTLDTRDIVLLRGVWSKYKAVIEASTSGERFIFGFDYYSHYSILSKKTHFSYVNPVYNHVRPRIYLLWSVLYILLIYENTMRVLNVKKDEIFTLVEPLVGHIKGVVPNRMIYVVNDFIFTEFGVGKIVLVNEFSYELQYEVSNCFKTGEKDLLPPFFIFGKVDAEFLEKTKNRLFSGNLDVYQGKEFDEFFQAMREHTKPQIVDVK